MALKHEGWRRQLNIFTAFVKAEEKEEINEKIVVAIVF
jgi:hypothetical protein